MHEFGLDLRIKGGKIILSYRMKEYEISSNPREDDTWICQDGKVIHVLRCGFQTSQIEKMIIRDKELKSITGRMIGCELMCDILACAIDDGRATLTFDYVEELGCQRRDKRDEKWKRRCQKHIEEGLISRREAKEVKKYQKPQSATPDAVKNLPWGAEKETKNTSDLITDGVLAYGVVVGRFLFQDGKMVVYAVSDLPHIGASDVCMVYQITKESYQKLLKMSQKNAIPDPPVPATITDACRIDFLCGDSAYCKRNSFTLLDVDLAHVESIYEYDKMPDKYFYRGETEREFYLTFCMAHDPDEYFLRERVKPGTEPEKPLGTIIVPKEFENSWIAERRYYLDWKVVVAPVAGRFIKGYNYPYWKLLKNNTNAELSGYKYSIYLDPEGRIIAQTPLTEFVIAETLEEYEQMSEEKVRSLCYCSEMGRAR